ncbi:MAG TPA: lysylphosphatidylglycerol synthase transmembrane domain-containing protein [Dehalococcoidia bacterium]|nr:lysylphosphatidylglycerol synthase transmembrane domain-containing protein [Dehalococcoidia bacterium]
MTTPTTNPPQPSPWRSRRTLLRLAVGILIGAVALYVVNSLAGGFDEVLDALTAANPWWLLPALVAEAACYAAIGVELRHLARPPTLPLSVALRAGLVNSGLGSVLPGSPAPGIALSVTELHRHGVPTGRAALALGWMSWFSARTLLAITAIVTLIAAAEGDFSDRTGTALTAAGVIVLLLAATAVLAVRGAALAPIAALAARLNIRGPRISREEARATGARWHADAMEAVGPLPRRLRIALLSASAWLADAACLYLALRSVGVHVGFEILLLAYCVGLISSALPLLPGGLGVVEAAVPTILHHYGVPLDAALAGTLAWRGLGLFLPAAVGLAALVSLRSTLPVTAPASP